MSTYRVTCGACGRSWRSPNGDAAYTSLRAHREEEHPGELGPAPEDATRERQPGEDDE